MHPDHYHCNLDMSTGSLHDATWPNMNGTPQTIRLNTKGYSSTYLAMRFAHVRVGTW